MRSAGILLSISLLALRFPAADAVAAQEVGPLPPLSPQQAQIIIDAASGDRALGHIRQLALHHRWFVSDGYLEAARYIGEQAGAAGLRDVTIERYPSDGDSYYSTDKSLPKWTVKSAVLRLVEPVSKHLVSWAENPIVLASNSRSAKVRAELVDVGEGVQASDYAGKEVRGKIVLASAPQSKGRIETVHRLAVLERGAAGVISYRSYHLDDFPDLVTWDHIWTLELQGKLSTFGFCVSKRMGWELKRLLQSGEKVVLQADVDASLSSGEYAVVTGHIPGSDPAGREIWFVAHLDHSQPSANDNASGSAAILETARVLRSLFDSGALPRPHRTLRFLWVPEIKGSYAFVSRHRDQARGAAAVVNMDMVGENQALCGSVFRVTQTPDSTPSFLNDLLRWNLDFMLAHNSEPGPGLLEPLAAVSPLGTRDPWKAAVIPYSQGSDHDVFMGGVVNIPATMLGSWPDAFYHSSGDTPDKSDPTQLKRAVAYGAMLGAAIAGMDGSSARELLGRMESSSLLRILQAAEQARQQLGQSSLAGDDLRQALNMVRWSVRRELRALASVVSLAPGDDGLAARLGEATRVLSRRQTALEEEIHAFYQGLCERRGQKAAAIPPLTPEEEEARTLIPARNPDFPGPIAMEYVAAKLQLQGRQFEDPFRGIERYELDAFIDGELNLMEIRDAVSAECGPLHIADVLRYVRVLADVGLISLRGR